MSTKTTFKRIALVAVAALGLGVLSVAPSQATIFGETLTIDAATDTATVGDTATAVLTHILSSTGNLESTTVRTTCTKPTAASACPVLNYWQTATSDTSGIVANVTAPTRFTTWSDTVSVSTASGRSVINVNAESFATAGTYTYTFYTYNSGATNALTAVVPFTWTITVSAQAATSATQINALYVSKDLATSENARKLYAASSDSAVVVAAGAVLSPTAVAYALLTVANTNGDTRTATATITKNTSSATAVTDTITATVSGPGLVSGVSSVKAKSATVNAYNGATFDYARTSTSESLTVWSDGTPGVSTITLSGSNGTVFSSFTVTFTGVPASAQVSLSDTIVAIGDSTNLVGIVKDSSASTLTSGVVYVFSSDTKVAGTNLSTNVYPTTASSCTIGAVTAGRISCAITVTDTGVATITLGDSWTVAASTWTSTAVSLTVTSDKVASLTISFDKATYAPGERAVITYTAKDVASRAMATTAATLTSVTNNVTFTELTGGTALGGSYASRASTLAGFKSWLDSGIETRVVTMPTFATAVSYDVVFPTFGSLTGLTTVSAKATVVDPNAAAIAAAKDASDAATDAALEATDAAYAATDAANIAAEAADAATAAAEAATEAANAAKESADAATAAVEELATSVAKLMAALQAQITTLAKVVAKIAVKVKA